MLLLTFYRLDKDASYNGTEYEEIFLISETTSHDAALPHPFPLNTSVPHQIPVQ